MRKLMWFTIGFVMACALGVYLGIGLWLAVMGVLLGVISYFVWREHRRILLLIALGISIGALWQWGYNSLYIVPISQYDSETIQSKITISDYSYETGYGVAADGKISLENRNYNVRVYLNTQQTLAPGDVLTGDFRLRLTTPDSNQGSTYHQGKGFFLLAYADEDIAVLSAKETPVLFFSAVLRKNIIDILDRVFSNDVQAFARALLLGDGSLLTYADDTAFKLSGIRHVIAVSGLHVSILFSLVYLFSGKHRILTALFGIPILVIFAAVAGFTPSVVRACVMQALMIFALLLNKEYDPPTSLAFAVIVMLLVNPLTITSVSFQLSISCIAGIFLFYQPFYEYLLRKAGDPKGYTTKTRVIRWLCTSVAVSVSATVATAPLSAIYFGTVSLVGVLTNLLTLWVVSFIFCGIMICCALGAFCVPAAVFVGKIVAIPIRYVMWVARLMSKPYFAAVYTCSIYVVAFLVFAYVLFAVMLISKRKRPVLFASCLAVGLLVTLFLSWLMPKLDRYRVTVFDVGQGQALLFQSQNKSYLIDCGGDNADMAADTVAAELLTQGIKELDGVILTHYDDDHAGGIQNLLTRVSTRTLYLPEISTSGNTKNELAEKYADRIQWIMQQTEIVDADMKFTLFVADEYADDNESSLCVLFQRENCDILLTGDRNMSGEAELLEQNKLPKLDALIVGHHGSGSATGLPLLLATKPDVAIISVGKGNSYGHPAQEVLNRLKLFRCHICRTDTDGTILIRG